MNKNKHPVVCGLIGAALLLAGVAGGIPADLWAQSSDPPAAGRAPEAPDTPKPVTAPEETKKEEENRTPDRSRSYRREKDPLKTFVPSEEIRVDKAVDFPVDI